MTPEPTTAADSCERCHESMVCDHGEGCLLGQVFAEADAAYEPDRDAAIDRVFAEKDKRGVSRSAATSTRSGRQETMRQAIRDRLAQIDKLMEAEPLGMVSKPHICWATDQLSILSRQVRTLLDEETS